MNSSTCSSWAFFSAGIAILIFQLLRNQFLAIQIAGILAVRTVQTVIERQIRSGSLRDIECAREGAASRSCGPGDRSAALSNTVITRSAAEIVRGCSLRKSPDRKAKATGSIGSSKTTGPR